MATSTRLRIRFSTMEGNDMTFNFNNAKNNPQASDVQALIQGLLANGSIYTSTPAIVKDAEIIQTTNTAIDLE